MKRTHPSVLQDSTAIPCLASVGRAVPMDVEAEHGLVANSLAIAEEYGRAIAATVKAD
jgi:hypothetical protein